jgi:hypothetical protein
VWPRISTGEVAESEADGRTSSAAQGGQGARAGRRHDAEEARGGCDINRLTQLIAFGQDRQGIAHLSGSQWFPLAVASERLLRAPIGERGDGVQREAEHAVSK